MLLPRSLGAAFFFGFLPTISCFVSGVEHSGEQEVVGVLHQVNQRKGVTSSAGRPLPVPFHDVWDPCLQFVLNSLSLECSGRSQPHCTGDHCPKSAEKKGDGGLGLRYAQEATQYPVHDSLMAVELFIINLILEADKLWGGIGGTCCLNQRPPLLNAGPAGNVVCERSAELAVQGPDGLGVRPLLMCLPHEGSHKGAGTVDKTSLARRLKSAAVRETARRKCAVRYLQEVQK
uniref:Putative secreted protein n=1 Tax=Ixodes ricinus TaxID=34613 RepID=A0A6B0V4T7_IXORI